MSSHKDVPGDGILDVYLDEGGKNMAEQVDLPAGVQAALLAQLFSDQIILLKESTGNIQSANNIVRHTAAKKFDQVDAIESSAVEKVLRATSNQANG